MTVRCLEHELAVAMGAVAERDDDVGSPFLDLSVKLVDVLHHDVKEPRVVPGLRRVDFVDTLAQHQMDPVPREKAPARCLDGIEAEAKYLSVVAGGSGQVTNCQD